MAERPRGTASSLGALAAVSRPLAPSEYPLSNDVSSATNLSLVARAEHSQRAEPVAGQTVAGQTVAGQTAAGATVALSVPSLLRLLQLVSPLLPVGSYAYSQGLEAMIDAGFIRTEAEASHYLEALMGRTLPWLELPLLHRMHHAKSAGQQDEAQRWSRVLLAARETSELQAQEGQMGRALMRVLRELLPPPQGATDPEAAIKAGAASPSAVSFLEAFAGACVSFEIPATAAASGYAYCWCECHVSAVARLLPLGPVASQRLLHALLEKLPELIQKALKVEDADIGATAHGLALLSALHETQYCRIYRS